MARLILDIETSGQEFETLDETSKQYFLKYARTEDEIKEAHMSLSFYPLTAEVVAIGMLNPESMRGAVYYQLPKLPEGTSEPEPPTQPSTPLEENGILFEGFADEVSMLVKFWDTVRSYESIITYNGRGFDCPFLHLRSAMKRIRPSRDLMPNRYSDIHIDLLDRLSYFGSVRRKFPLDLWCKAFGIKSPKEETTGYEVPGMFREGRTLDIARYCAKDLFATRELLEYYDTYIRFP